MRALLVLAALSVLAGGGSAAAQTSPGAATGVPDGPAVSGKAVDERTTGDKATGDAMRGGSGMVGEPLEAGANSFTEAQVKERFAKMGFGALTDLRKDDQGIWRGKAMHAGKEVTIGMDYKGNVAAQ